VIVDPELLPDRTLSRFVLTPEFGTPADGATSVAIEVVLANREGRPIRGARVELEVSGSGNLWQPLDPTDGDGRTTGALASIAGERKTVRARTTSGGPRTDFGPLGVDFLLIPAATYFVLPGGSDANSGRSPRDAWRSLAHALGRLGPGDTLHLAPGVYAGPFEVGVDSSAGPPFVLAGDPEGHVTGRSGDVVIEAGGAPAALRLRGGRNVTFQGLVLRGAEVGLVLEDCADVRVLACRFEENDTGLAATRVEDLRVTDCRASQSRAAGVRLEDTRRARLENNLLYANLGTGLVLGEPSFDAHVRFNTFFHHGLHHLRATQAGGSGILEGNILSDSGQAAVVLPLGTGLAAQDNLLWDDGPGIGRSPGGFVEANPLFAAPFGPDGILGGSGARDDDFRVLPGSVSLDLGRLLARDVVLATRESLATRGTRADGVLEGQADDLLFTNLGHHVAPADPPFESLLPDGGRLAFARLGTLRVRAAAWAPSHPSRPTEFAGPAWDGELVYLEARGDPRSSPEEILAAQVDTGTRGRIVVRHWDGRRWGEPARAPFLDGFPRERLADRRFDVEHEGLSGDALLVFADGDGVPSYQRLESGRWSEPAPVTDEPSGPEDVLWVELVAQAGSDELALVTLDELHDLYVSIWDGAAFGPRRLLEGNTLHSPGWRPFDAAFEGRSGDLLVVWGFSVFAEQNRWASRERASGRWTGGLNPSADAIGAHLVLSAEPGGDRIVSLSAEADLDNDVTVAVWDGEGWVHGAELTLAAPRASRLLEAAWLGDSGRALVVFRRQGLAGSFNVAILEPTGWRVQPDVVLPGVAKAVQVRLAGHPSAERLLGWVLDANGRLFGLRHDGQRFRLLEGGLAAASGFDSTAPGRPFDVFLRR
jgi:hypothetical protein